MLKNINDYLSFVALIALLISLARVFFGYVFNINSNSNIRKRFKLVKEYYDNEEE